MVTELVVAEFVAAVFLVAELVEATKHRSDSSCKR